MSLLSNLKPLPWTLLSNLMGLLSNLGWLTFKPCPYITGTLALHHAKVLKDSENSKYSEYLENSELCKNSENSKYSDNLAIPIGLLGILHKYTENMHNYAYSIF